MTFQDKILDEYQLKFGDEWKKRYDIDMYYGKVPFCSEDEFLSMLTFIQIERDYAPGWIAHRYKRLYQAWPEEWWDREPLEPSPEFDSWMATIENLKKKRPPAAGNAG